jgi:TatD DNase family protein
MTALIDAHLHLEALPDPAAALARAGGAGVTAVVAVSLDRASSERTLALPGKAAGVRVYPAVGVHPAYLSADDPAPVLTLIDDHLPEIVAVGEIGLDYRLPDARRNPENRGRQRAVFRQLLTRCAEADLPAVIHGRGAWPDALRLTREAGPHRAVFHGYDGPLDLLDEILAAGYWISANPAAEFSRRHRAAVSHAPIEKILIETDAPVRYNRVSAELADLGRTRDIVSQIKRIPSEEVARRTARAARAVFGIKDR